MTTNNLDSGDKIDALVAEKVMRWKWFPVPWLNDQQKILAPNESYATESNITIGDGVLKFVPKYSSNIHLAMTALNQLDMKSVYMVWNDSGSMWEVYLDRGRRVMEDCRFCGWGDGDYSEDPFERLPLAICRAILNSLEGGNKRTVTA